MGDTRELRALHVIAGLDPAHGGPSYSVPRLCRALSEGGTAASLFSVKMGQSLRHAESQLIESLYAWDYARIPGLRGLRYSSGLSNALFRAVPDADVVHDHGIWLMPNVAAGRIAARFGKPFIVSPRGMLAPPALAFSPKKKRLFWSMLQGPVVRHAACLHATSEQEYCELRAFGLRNPIAVIPNGIDLPDADIQASRTAERVVLTLGRLHPKKGLDVLIRAWAKAAAAFGNWELRIVGPAEDRYDEELQLLVQSLGAPKVSIAGAIYGEAKTAALRNADLFVLPTRNENFGLTVAEALAVGTPAISSKGAPWRGLEIEGCGWWVDGDVEALAAALGHAMAMPREALRAMGARGRTWVARDFSWDRIAVDMLAVYRWLARGEEPPAIVRFA